MTSQPTLISSLKEHLKFARELRNLEIHFYPEKCKGVWQKSGWSAFTIPSAASRAARVCCSALKTQSN